MDRPNFHFRRREEKLDWKKLAALDVDQIAKTVDYKALQDSIRQITYCDAGKEFDSSAADPNLVKVFRMSQLIIEYLLQSQDFLANNLASVEQRLNTTLEELEAARTRSRRDQEELRDLRKGLRAPASSTVMTLTGHQRCQFCQKVFINTTYLQSHMMRRHNHMVSKQMSNQTLSTVAPHEQPAPTSTLEAELEQVRRRLMVAEQQLREERHRVAALEQHGGAYQQPDDMHEPGSPTYHETIKEEPEPLPEDQAPPGGSAQGSHQGSAAGSRQGSGTGSRRGSGSGSQQGSGGGASRQGSGGGSRQGSGGGSRQGSGGGSQKGSGGGSQKGSGSGSQKGSGGGSQKGSGGGSPGLGGGSVAESAGQRDSQLAVLLEQQAAEIRQLREELERQRQAMQMGVPQPPAAAPALLGGTASGPPPLPPDPANRVEQEIEKQARREVVALEGQMEAQERYWQDRLAAMRDRHDAEVEGMRKMLNEKSVGVRGSAEYVNIDSGSGAEPSPQSPRLLRYVHRHQSPSPGPPGAPPPPGSGRGARQRPRPCIAPPQSRQRRSRSVSGCRRLKFADDDEECEEEEETTARGVPRESYSSDALTGNGAPGGRPRVRQELEHELNERLLELGIEPGTRRLPSGLMSDKMKHLQLTRQVLGFGDLRRQVDQDLNQRLTKFVAVPSKRTSKLALFAKDIMHRGAEMSRSLVTLGGRNRATCTSATIDAQLMKRMMAAEKAQGRPRASSESPTSARRPLDESAASPGWPRGEPRRDEADWQQTRQRARYEATSYEEEEDFRPRQGGRKFKFKANASKHILERFTRRGQCQSSLIKSTTIHRVESGRELDGDGGDPSGRYEKLREDRPPAGRQGSNSSLAASRRASTERQQPASRSGSVPSVGSGGGGPGGLMPGGPNEDGFVTPMSRPMSGSADGPPRLPEPPGSPGSVGSPGSPAIPQIGSGSMTPKQNSFDNSEMSNRVESSPPPPAIPTIDPVDARPSGSANTLSTSQWNSAADGGAAADSSAADETETRTSHTTGSSSSEGDSESEEDEEEDTATGDQ